MFDPFTLALIGGAIGGLANKKDPLKGALMGAAAGYGGGLLGGAGAAGASGTGVAGGLTATAGEGMALAATPASGSLGSGLTMNGLLNATPAAESGLLGSGLSAPSTGYFSANAASGAAPSFLDQLKTLNSNVKPFGEAAGNAMAVKGLMAPQDAMTPPPAPMQSQPLDLSGVLSANQQEMAKTFEEDMKRRQSMGAFAQYAMGAR